MNPFNSCCKIASLAFCLVLGFEFLVFGHGVSAQARSLEGLAATPRQNPVVLAGTMLASEKVVGN